MENLAVKRGRTGEIILAVATAVFLAVELGFFVAVQLDFHGINHIVNYASVIVAVAFGLVSAAFNTRGEWLLRLGLICTLFADYHLVYSYPMDRLLGMVFFNFTQLSYFLYLLLRDGTAKRRLVHTSIRLGVIAVAVALCYLVLGEGADTLSVISMIYFANLATSVAWCLASRKFLLFAGLLSFALCDVTVGIGALADLYINVAEGSFMWRVIHSDFNIIWFFYVPSQTVIALATLGRRGRELWSRLLARVRIPRRKI